MLDPLTIGVGGLLWLAFRKQANTQFGVLTPEREEIYNTALEFLHDPMRLEKLAAEFQREGLKVQAAMLKKRAEWRARNPEQKAAHETIFQKAMASTNIHAILDVAKAFEQLTATAKAKQLRERAKLLYQQNEKAAAEAATAAESVVEKAHDEVKRGEELVSKVTGENIPRNTDDDEDSTPPAELIQ